MPVYLTVQQFQKEYTKHIKDISESTVRRWIDEETGKLKVKRDHGGWGILIVIEETDILFPFLVRNPKHLMQK